MSNPDPNEKVPTGFLADVARTHAPETPDERVKKLLLIADQLLEDPKATAAQKDFADLVNRLLVLDLTLPGQVLLSRGRAESFEGDQILRYTVEEAELTAPFNSTGGPPEVRLRLSVDMVALRDRDTRLPKFAENRVVDQLAQLVVAATYAAKSRRLASVGFAGEAVDELNNRHTLEQQINASLQLLNRIKKRSER